MQQRPSQRSAITSRSLSTTSLTIWARTKDILSSRGSGPLPLQTLKWTDARVPLVSKVSLCLLYSLIIKLNSSRRESSSPCTLYRSIFLASPIEDDVFLLDCSKRGEVVLSATSTPYPTSAVTFHTLNERLDGSGGYKRLLRKARRRISRGPGLCSAYKFHSGQEILPKPNACSERGIQGVGNRSGTDVHARPVPIGSNIPLHPNVPGINLACHGETGELGDTLKALILGTGITIARTLS